MWGTHRVSSHEIDKGEVHVCEKCGLELKITSGDERSLTCEAAMAPTIFHLLPCVEIRTGVAGKNASIPASFVPLGTRTLGGEGDE